FNLDDITRLVRVMRDWTWDRWQKAPGQPLANAYLREHTRYSMLLERMQQVRQHAPDLRYTLAKLADTKRSCTSPAPPESRSSSRTSSWTITWGADAAIGRATWSVPGRKTAGGLTCSTPTVAKRTEPTFSPAPMPWRHLVGASKTRATVVSACSASTRIPFLSGR